MIGFPVQLLMFGGFRRFLGAEMAEKYELDVPDYQGVDQIVEVPVAGLKL